MPIIWLVSATNRKNFFAIRPDRMVFFYVNEGLFNAENFNL